MPKLQASTLGNNRVKLHVYVYACDTDAMVQYYEYIKYKNIFFE